MKITLVLFAALLASCAVCAGSGNRSRVVTLPAFGHAGLGGDDTAVIQRALVMAAAARQTLRIPASPKPYRVRPIHLPGNTNLLLDEGVVIEAVPGYLMNECVINIEDAANVNLTGYGATITMPKAEYTRGEWRHALRIGGSTNVVVRGLSCSNSGGDGIYISGGESKRYSENLLIEDVTADNNRRQGMSIISAQNLVVRHCRFTNTNGTAPQDGIDLEPNGPDERLANILIEDCVTQGNKGDGIGVSLGQLDNTSADISITIARNRDGNSGGSGYLATGIEKGEKDVKGRVLFDACTTRNAGAYGAAAIFWESTGPLATFRDLTVIDPNQGGENIDKSAIIVKRGGGALGPMGCVHFLNPRIEITDGKVDYYFSYHDWSNIGIKDVKIVNPTFRGASRHPYGMLEEKQVTTVAVP